jgi:hypothetical protein
MHRHFFKKFTLILALSSFALQAQSSQKDVKLFTEFMICAQGFVPKIKTIYQQDKDFGVALLLTAVMPDSRAINSAPSIPNKVKKVATSVPTGFRKTALVKMLTSCDSVFTSKKPSNPYFQNYMATAYSDHVQLIKHIESEEFQLIQIMKLKQANDAKVEPLMKEFMTPSFMRELSNSGLMNQIQNLTSEFESVFNYIAKDYNLKLK